MPRNASGTYTLPVAAYVSGTVIKSADMNSNLSDIATALTQSIASTGVTPITSPLFFVTGTVGAPGISFVGDPNTGIYQPAADQMAISCGGTQAIAFAANSVIIPSNSTIVFNATVYAFTAPTATAFLLALGQNYSISFTIDGGGSVPTLGTKGFTEVACDSTIIRSTILADQSGSCVVTIQKSSYAGFPPSASIVASAPPTLSGAQKAQDTTLSGWTTALTNGDILAWVLTSATTVTRIQVFLLCKRISQ